MSKKKCCFKKESIIWCIYITLIVVGPFIINGSYKKGCGYITLWGAKDVLNYYGIVVTSIAALKVTIDFSKANTDLQKNTLKKDTYSEIYIKKFFIYDYDNHNCFRFICNTNNDFNKKINIKKLTIYCSKGEDGIISSDKIEFKCCETNFNKHHEENAKYCSFDVQTKENMNGIKQKLENERVRVVLKYELINIFEVITYASGELMLNRKDESGRITFKTTDDFTSVENIYML